MKLTRKQTEEGGEPKAAKAPKPPKAPKEPKAPKAPKPPKAPKAAKPPKARRARSEGEEGKARGRKQFVLVLGDEGAILVYMQGRTVVRRLFSRSPAPEHTDALLELLRSQPRVPITVLIDVMDQQYVRHNFPPVSPLSLNGLVKRRIERDFQAEDITGAIRLGREPGGRKEWQYLLISLANTPLVQQWLDLLIEQPNELKGLYLTPVEGQGYLPQLHTAMTSARPLPWLLLVSHHKVSGFRQIVLKNGKLIFTRVTQSIDDALPAVVAGSIEQEIMNTLEYLRRLGLEDNSTMEMMVVASQEVREALDLNRFSAGLSGVFTPLEVAEHLGLEQAALSADRFGDVVMAAAFGRARKHQLKLMTAYATKLSQLYAARIGIKLVGVLGVVGLLIMSATNMIDMLANYSKASDLDARRAPLQAQVETVRKALSGLNEDVTFKSAVMLTYDAYMKDAQNPNDLVAALAPNLTPDIRVRKMVWGKLQQMGQANAGAPPSPMMRTPGARGMAMPQPGDDMVSTEIEFEFTQPFADTDELATVVTAFIEKLKTEMPNYDISNDPFPWEKETPKNLEISFDQPTPNKPALREGENRILLKFSGPRAVEQVNPNAPPATPSMPVPGGRR